MHVLFRLGEVKGMAERIISVRTQLFDRLKAKGVSLHLLAMRSHATDTCIVLDRIG